MTEKNEMPIGSGGFNFVRMRYHIKNLPERISESKNQSGRDLEKPCGVHLEPPWYGAKVLYVDERDGYVYVWWIDDALTKGKKGLGLTPAGSSA